MQSDQTPAPNYNFIMSNAPQKKGILDGKSKNNRILIFAIGIGILLVVFGLIFSFLFGRGSGNTTGLVSLAAQQTEIIRIAEIGEKEAKSTDTKNFASTVKLSMTSARNSLMDQLEKQGRKPSSKDLAASEDPDTDVALLAATHANRFDEVFTETLQSAVNDYQVAVRQAYEAASSTKQKISLNNIYKQTETLATDQN